MKLPKLLRDPRKPKSPRSAYSMYELDLLPRVLEKNPELTQMQARKECKAMFENEPKEFQAMYTERYKEAKEEHKEQIKVYDKTRKIEFQEDKKKYERNLSKPIAPQSPYYYWVQELRLNCDVPSPRDSYADALSCIQERWENLPKEEKVHYEEKHTDLLDQYEKALKVFEQSTFDLIFLAGHEKWDNLRKEIYLKYYPESELE